MSLQRVANWEKVSFKLSIYFELMFLASIKHTFWVDITLKLLTHTNTILIT